jgi:hypothetical protein
VLQIELRFFISQKKRDIIDSMLANNLGKRIVKNSGRIKCQWNGGKLNAQRL